MRGALIALLLAARRAALRARRGGRSGSYVLWTAASGLLLGLALSLAAGFALALWMVGLWWLGLIVIGLLVWGYFPWALARAVAVPAGLPRLAFKLGAQSREAEGDPVGGGLILAAWATCRRRAPDRDELAWIEAQRDGSGRLGDCRVVATALLSAARGDRDGARQLLESLPLLPEVTPIARELAAEWLAVDDAERGTWSRILDRAPRRGHAQLRVDPAELDLPPAIGELGRPAGAEAPLWPATPLTYLLEGVAARLLGVAGAPGDLSLWVRWLEAPHRRHTWALLGRAVETVRAGAAAPPAAAAPAEPAAIDDPLAGAVATHLAALAALGRGTLDRAQVIAAAAAWDAALASSEIRTSVLARAIDVGAPADAGHKVLDELARTAAEDLALLVVAAELPVAELRSAAGSRTLEAAVQRIRHRLLDELEVAVSRTAERVHATRALPAIDEWREVLALRRAHRRAIAIGGDELRRLAFPHLHGELTSWLVWLWNTRDEHVLSEALTCWLLAEALAVGDAQAIETHAKNAGLELPRRAGA